jgi:hypothetical protein
MNVMRQFFYIGIMLISVNGYANNVCFSDTMQDLCINHYLHGRCAQYVNSDQKIRCHLMDKTTTKCKRLGCLNIF